MGPVKTAPLATAFVTGSQLIFVGAALRPADRTSVHRDAGGSQTRSYNLKRKMIVQIYEIGSAEEARAVAETGVDHVGVLVGPGEFPREISIENAKPILAAVRAPSKGVVLTLSRNPDWIREIIRTLQPEILHLGTLPEALSPESVAALKAEFTRLKIMRSIPVIGEDSITLAMEYDGVVDFLLLDSHNKDDNQIGATGNIHDWTISRKTVESVSTPVILAGGLGPENVAAAIREVRPAGVDSKTKTDLTGTHRKDLAKVRDFVIAAY